MIDIDEAHLILMQHVSPGSAQTVSLEKALNRTLASPISTDVDYPPFDRSLMDGFAVRARDTENAPVQLHLVGTVNAGALSSIELQAGQAIRINTGAPIPPGADAIVRVEETQTLKNGQHVRIEKPAGNGQFITPRGQYARAGQTVLAAGTHLGPLEIAVAVSASASEVAVYRQSQVAILTTGNELVDVGEPLTGAMIRNSNRYLLDALVRDAHATPIHLGTAGDDRAELAAKIDAGLQYDVLCVTGGVSMGTLDLVPDVLIECGAEFHVHKMGIKPGRPVIFATAPSGTLIFALPGNPISAFVCFELLVRPALAAREGRPGALPRRIKALLDGQLAPTRDRRSYSPARLATDEHGGLLAKPLSWSGSGDPFGMATADALIERPPNSPEARTGQSIHVLALTRL